MTIRQALKPFFSQAEIQTHLFVLLFTISWAVTFSAKKTTVHPAFFFLIFVAGWLIWTLAEYLYNRFLLHEGHLGGIKVNPWKKFHDHHHRNPENPEYMIFPASLIILSGFIITISFWIIFTWLSFTILAGFLFGYLVFICIHYFQHSSEIKRGGYLFPLWRQHYLHHTRYPDAGFGVSTGLWDKLFNSTPGRHEFLKVDLSSLTLADDRILVVGSKDLEELFIKAGTAIYQHDPNWVQPILSEVKSVFNESKNPFFRHGTVKRWVLLRNNEVIGRIAAFVDYEKMVEDGKRIGKIGFFECINDEEAAISLFRTACCWLWEKYAVDTVEGPVNFGENDKFWGLQVSGTDFPSYGMNYNPEYYVRLFTSAGFREHYRQFTNKITLDTPLPERFRRIAERVESKDNFRFSHFSWNEQEKYIKDFVSIYNQAWANFKNFTPLSEEYLRNSLQELKPVMEEDFIWFAYINENPAGLVVGVPDANEALRNIRGDLNWRNKLKFVAFKHFKGFSRARVIIMGVVPEYQRLGLESALILKAFDAGRKKPDYKEVLLAWVGDFNDKMLGIHHAMNAKPHTVHATFRLDLKQHKHLTES